MNPFVSKKQIAINLNPSGDSTLLAVTRKSLFTRCIFTQRVSSFTQCISCLHTAYVYIHMHAYVYTMSIYSMATFTQRLYLQDVFITPPAP